MNTTSEESVALNQYELMLIYFADLGEESINKELNELEKHLQADGGNIFNKDIWGARDLAYKIRKQTEGYYVVLNINLPPDKISEFEKSLNIHPTVLRYLLTKLPLNYILKTFAEYKAESDEAALKKAEARKAKEEEKMAQRNKIAPQRTKPEPAAEPRVEKPKVEKKEAPVVEEAQAVEEEVAEVPVKKVKKPEKSKLELDEVDEKLKNIINDPDISL